MCIILAMFVITRYTTLQQPYILFNPAIITPLKGVFDEMFRAATVDKDFYSNIFNALIVYFIHMVLDYGDKKQIAGWVNTIVSGMSVMYPTLSDGSNNKRELCKWLRAAVARSPYRYPSALEIISKLGLLREKPLPMRHHLSLVNGETPLLIEVELSATRLGSSSIQNVTTQSNTDTDTKLKRGTKRNIFCNAESGGAVKPSKVANNDVAKPTSDNDSDPDFVPQGQLSLRAPHDLV
jgi:hypothetical protein